MVSVGFTDAQQALWDAARSTVPYTVSRFAIEEVASSCHKPKCHQHHPDSDELVELLWKSFCDALRERALTLEDGKGAE